MSVERLVIDCAARKLRQLEERIEACLGKLSDEQIWGRAGENSNAAGNLCLHLAGNVRQWILHGVGGAPDVRQRDAEFAARAGVARQELLKRLRETVAEACLTLQALPEARMTEMIRPQNFDLSVTEAILHVVEHFAEHTGQIILLTKACTGEDLGFYAYLKAPAPGTPHSQQP
ncbi:MAG: DinB family protein [Bryobacteraceae bacterium]